MLFLWLAFSRWETLNPQGHWFLRSRSSCCFFQLNKKRLTMFKSWYFAQMHAFLRPVSLAFFEAAKCDCWGQRQVARGGLFRISQQLVEPVWTISVSGYPMNCSNCVSLYFMIISHIIGGLIIYIYIYEQSSKLANTRICIGWTLVFRKCKKLRLAMGPSQIAIPHFEC